MKSHNSIDAPRADVSAAITPDWRHAKAIEIISRPRSKQPDGRRGRYASQKTLDSLTLRYVEFLRRTLGYTTKRGMRTVARKYPDMFLAQQVSNEPTLRPLEIQARVLAGQSDRTIARAVGLPIGTLATYLGLFFDIRDRLKARSWIRWVAIGLPLNQAASVESIMLWHCWQRGSAVVEPWLDFIQNQAESHDLGTAVSRQRAAIQLLIDIHQMPNVPEIQKSFFKKFAYIAKKLRETPKTASIGGVVARNEGKILREIRWRQSEKGEFSAHQNRCPAPCEAEFLEFGQFAKAG